MEGERQHMAPRCGTGTHSSPIMVGRQACDDCSPTQAAYWPRNYVTMIRAFALARIGDQWDGKMDGSWGWVLVTVARSAPCLRVFTEGPTTALHVNAGDDAPAHRRQGCQARPAAEVSRTAMWLARAAAGVASGLGRQPITGRHGRRQTDRASWVPHHSDQDLFRGGGVNVYAAMSFGDGTCA